MEPATVSSVIGSQAPSSGVAAQRARTRYTVDPGCTIINMIEDRLVHRDWRDRPALQPHSSCARDMLPAIAVRDDAASAYCTRHVHTSVNNRERCAVHTISYVPDKPRIVTGSAAGQFTAWHSGTFNFDAVVQAHLYPIRSMRWSNDGEWMLTGDEKGVVKYWQSSLRAQEDFVAHNDAAVRSITFAPSGRKFATCSDDKSVRVWDFWERSLDIELRGHNADVYSVSWHPAAALLASGSRDTTVRLWDAKSGKEVRTLKAHKNEVLHVSWNVVNSGTWLLTASRDQTILVYDVRALDAGPFESFVAEHRGITAAAWHPAVEALLAVGHLDGALQHWVVGAGNVPQADVPHAHDSAVRDVAWAPGGNGLVSVSNDTTTKFWARSRPGDRAAQYAYQGNPIRQYPDRNTNVVAVAGNGGQQWPATFGGTTAVSASSSGSSLLQQQAMTFEEIEAESRRFVAVEGGERVAAVARGDFAAAARAAGAALQNSGANIGARAGGAGVGASAVGRPAAGGLSSASSATNAAQALGGGATMHAGGPLSGAAAGSTAGGVAGAMSRPPGAGYVCKKCGKPDHWVKDCPSTERAPPGPGYVCNKCAYAEWRLDSWLVF